MGIFELIAQILSLFEKLTRVTFVSHIPSFSFLFFFLHKNKKRKSHGVYNLKENMQLFKMISGNNEAMPIGEIILDIYCESCWPIGVVYETHNHAPS